MMEAYIDGSSKGMYGYLLSSNRDNPKVIQDYPMTSNQAEWLALITLLMDLKKNSKITIFSDSSLVVKQFTSIWSTKNKLLKEYKRLSSQIIRTKNLKIELYWIPRKENFFGKYLDRIVRKEKKERKDFRAKLQRGYF